jgi:hypothetical protein
MLNWKNLSTSNEGSNSPFFPSSILKPFFPHTLLFFTYNLNRKQMNKNYVINNGSFTANGNFSGYTALGDRIHLHKRQMESLGWKANADVKFPFYTIATIKQIGQLGADGKPVLDASGLPATSDRLTALSAFKTRDEIKQAHADASLLDIEIAQEIKAQASSAGLTEETFKALANTPF